MTNSNLYSILIDKKGVGIKSHSLICKGGVMESKVKELLDDKIKDLNLFVSSVYYSNEEGIKTLNIELDSNEVIDVNKITEATKIINPIMDDNNLCDDIDVLDIHSKEKGDE